MTAELPRRIELPSGRIAVLKRAAVGDRAKTKPSLFEESLALLDTGAIEVWIEKKRVAVDDLRLVELHTLRAFFAAADLVPEDPVSVPCKNCEATITLRPSLALPRAPFIDAELDDPELDERLDFATDHAIPELRVGRGKQATVRLTEVTVGAARGLFSALTKRALRVSPAVARGMGIEAIGRVRDPERIADALADASEDVFGAITNLFLRAHYPLRLGAVATCADCGARNDVDAPYDREFEPWRTEPCDADAKDPFVSLEAFASSARAIAKDELGPAFENEITLVVDGEVPACDDGGEPLLGSYVPGTDGDHGMPSRAPEITVYYRTFRAMWDEEAGFDWNAELRETIEHEFEHHRADGRGHDAVDDEERAEIVREAGRVLGKKALARGAATHLGRDFAEFLRRTWPIWVVALIAIIATIITTK
ncbi:hypothetical protein BH09MYX1_BH09MYX1_45120 [soil metagenome]